MSVSGLNLGLRALSANQLALEVTGQNIANVNTEGYTRQRAHLVATEALRKSFGMLGTGVEVNGIERIRDAFIDLEIKGQKSKTGAFEVEADIYDRMESIFNDPSDNGIDTLLGDFFDGLYDVANSPEDIGIRNIPIIKAQILAQQIQFTNDQLDQLRLDIDSAIESSVSEINTITSQIGDLNKEIAKLEAGTMYQANDLRDERDQLIKDLAEIADITTFETEDGAININMSGLNIVFGSITRELDTQLRTGDELPIHDVIVKDSGAIINFTGGKMKGYFDSRDTNIVHNINELDTLARGLIDYINELHVDGRGIQGIDSISSVNGVTDTSVAIDSAGLDITPVDSQFDIVVLDKSVNPCTETTVTISVDADTDSLEDIRDDINAQLTGQGIAEISASINSDNELVIESSDSDFTFAFANATDDSSNFLCAMGLNTFFTGTDASNIAVNDFIADNPEYFAAADSFAAGDNTKALQMAELRTSRILSNSSKTFEEFYQNTIVTLGSNSKGVRTEWEVSDSYLTQLQLKRETVSGVNLDEEAANLIKYQRAYEASARYINVVDSLLNTLVNGLI